MAWLTCQNMITTFALLRGCLRKGPVFRLMFFGTSSRRPRPSLSSWCYFTNHSASSLLGAIAPRYDAPLNSYLPYSWGSLTPPHAKGCCRHPLLLSTWSLTLLSKVSAYGIQPLVGSKLWFHIMFLRSYGLWGDIPFAQIYVKAHSSLSGRRMLWCPPTSPFLVNT